MIETSQQPFEHSPDPYVGQLVREAMYSPEAERDEQLRLVQELAGELAVAEALQAYVAEQAEIAAQNPYNQQLTRSDKVEHLTTMVDFDKIDWISRKGTEELSIVKHDGDVPFYLANLIHSDRVADRAYANLSRSNDAERVTNKLVKDVIPRLWLGMQSGDGSVRTEHGIKTRYPAYKVGVFGTQNRAVLLLLNKTADIPTFGIAALYDHDDQNDIIRHMYTTKPRSK